MLPVNVNSKCGLFFFVQKREQLTVIYSNLHSLGCFFWYGSFAGDETKKHGVKQTIIGKSKREE